MMSWILLIVVLISLIIIGSWAWGSIVGRGTVMDTPDEAVDVDCENLRALEEGRFDDLRFDVVPRGYRQDQVDALIAAVERRLTAPHGSSAVPAGANVPLESEKGLD